MDARTLATAMGCSAATAERYVADVNTALIQAGCTTVSRVAMYCAQVGHESAGLRYMEEIASGQQYEGRRDLGNVHPGDGRRFKGRGPIQLTGRSNYARFGQWCKDIGRVSDSAYFVNHPEAVATSGWGFLAVSWYWTQARQMNSYADRGDIVGATRAVNGGTNGLPDRTVRWNRCRALGNALLPSGTGAATPLDPIQEEQVSVLLPPGAGMSATIVVPRWATEIVIGLGFGPMKVRGLYLYGDIYSNTDRSAKDWKGGYSAWDQDPDRPFVYHIPPDKLGQVVTATLWYDQDRSERFAAFGAR